MELSVIIVNWNTREMLKECLNSIRENTNSKKVKTIVVDNASSDGSREITEKLFPEVHLINSGGNIGFGRAANIAIPYADTPLVLFLNPDTVVLENTIQKMADFLKGNPQVGGLGCKMKSPTGIVHRDRDAHELGLQWFPSPFKELINMVLLSDITTQRFKKYLPYHDPNISGYVSKLYGGCLMVRKEVLEQVGHFDERFFMYCEDGDLSYRIIKGGWKLYYLSDAEILHVSGGASQNTSNNLTLMRYESMRKLMQKYYGKRGEVCYKVVVFIGSLFRLIVLMTMEIVSFLSSFDRKMKYKESFKRYVAIIKWSIGLQKLINL